MLAQVLAIIIFLAMFLLIILEIWERQWITLACGLLYRVSLQPDSGMQQVNPARLLPVSTGRRSFLSPA